MMRRQPKIKIKVWTDQKVKRVTLCPSDSFSYRIYGPSLNLEAFFDAYLRGENPSLPPLDWESVTPFTKTVLQALTTIPFGDSRSYGQIATQIGCPGGSRAVGGALGRNPFPFLLPCHRVISKCGLGGFSAGLELKQHLIEYETTTFLALN